MAESLKRLTAQAKSFADREGAAEKGDRLTIDFVGKIDGVAFSGGEGKDVDLTLGSDMFIGTLNFTSAASSSVTVGGSNVLTRAEWLAARRATNFWKALEKSGKVIEVITSNDASNTECSMSDVDVFIISRHFGG